MLTPLEINSREFRQVWRGYNPQEVDQFLSQVAKDFEALQKQNAVLSEEIAELKKRLQKYNDLQEGIAETLQLARETAAELKQDAEQQAEAVLSRARAEAERIVEEAQAKVQSQLERLHRLREQEEQMRRQLRSLLRSFLETLSEEEEQADVALPEANGDLAQAAGEEPLASFEGEDVVDAAEEQAESDSPRED